MCVLLFFMFAFLFIVVLFIFSVITPCAANEEIEEIEPVHYAFSNYLGNGIYRTANQSVTLVNLPFSYDLNKKGNFTYGIRLPLSLGFFDFDFDLGDIPEFEFPDKVGTLTFTPGISVGYQINENWALESYIDIGFAHNFTTSNNASVQSAGVSALYNFTLDSIDAVWVNRTYIASYNGIKQRSSDSYAALQTGIDIGFPVSFEFAGKKFQPRLFSTAFWYFREVEFFNATYATKASQEENISLQNSIEIGATLRVDDGIGYSWASIDTIGIGYRFTQKFNAVRLIFSMPI